MTKCVLMAYAFRVRWYCDRWCEACMKARLGALGIVIVLDR